MQLYEATNACRMSTLKLSMGMISSCAVMDGSTTIIIIMTPLLVLITCIASIYSCPFRDICHYTMHLAIFLEFIFHSR